ncbi:hypothetical protein FJT64_020475 [Amphibalanus amphitrite]|uniref:G-protein coupled receptors family 1 profile domain-containing protein n=1 Tax=Amphibalanus amphitrite TaxID=1232801 RepID=A0A6A4WX83_AMPAM|nr:hypothetical protein FJT64_020475 [Amphibalanus amphitrite]
MSASGSDRQLKHVPAVLVDLLPEDLSEMCLLKLTERLQCEVEEEEEGSNSSRLVCGPRDGGSTAADVARAHAVLLTVIVVTVLLALTLNSIRQPAALDRVPMIEADIDAHLTPFLCAVRVNVIRTTATFNFGLLVTITFLRYLIVVRRHSYPPHRRNLALFTVIASLPCLVRTVIFYDAISGTCGTFLAWSRDNYIINRLSEKDNRLRMAVVGLEYVFGIVVIVFCYANILAEAVASRRRLKTHATRASGPADFQSSAENARYNISSTHSLLQSYSGFLYNTAIVIIVLGIHFCVDLGWDIGAGPLRALAVCADLKCFVMPTMRLKAFTLVTLSGGITAVFNPLVCVVFSTEFRRACRQTLVRIRRRLRWQE